MNLISAKMKHGALHAPWSSTYDLTFFMSSTVALKDSVLLASNTNAATSALGCMGTGQAKSEPSFLCSDANSGAYKNDYQTNSSFPKEATNPLEAAVTNNPSNLVSRHFYQIQACMGHLGLTCLGPAGSVYRARWGAVWAAALPGSSSWLPW